MSDGKYSKNILTDVVIPGKTAKFMVSTRQLNDFGDGNYSMDCVYITFPRVINPDNHSHTFAQYFCFLSANPDDPRDFDAQVELSLGEEQEKQIITTPSICYIPAGLHHCPLNFAKVNKPLLFLDIAMTNKYARVGEKKE